MKPICKSTSLQLFSTQARYDSDQSESDGDKVTIRGFASVERVDRDGDIVSPLAFNIKTFMNTGTVLVNHKFFVDPDGNQVKVGKTRQMVAAYLAESNPENESDWIIRSIETSDQITTFPKEKVPELKAGDRGLYVVIDVTQPDMVKKVRDGEFGAFSWKGTVLKKPTLLGGQVVNRFLSVDMQEISIVDIPSSNQSNFVLSKGFGDDLEVCQILFDKSNFQTAKTVSDFLETHNIPYRDLYQDDSRYFVADPAIKTYDLSKSVRVEMGDATYVLAAKMPEDLDVAAGREGAVSHRAGKSSKKSTDKGKLMKLFTFSQDSLRRLFGDDYSTASKTVTVGEAEVEVIEVQAKEAGEAPDFDKLVADGIEKFKSTLDLDGLKKGFEDAIKDVGEKLIAIETRLGETETKFASLENKEAVESPVAAKEEDLEAVKGVLVKVIEQHTSLNDSLQAIAKSVQGLSKAVPATGDRQESQKSTQKPTVDAGEDFFRRVLVG